MNCHKCHQPSRLVPGRRDGHGLRQCTSGHRWLTSLLEVRETDPTEPATRETARAMQSQGKSVRQIAASLLVSTRTVQAWTSGPRRRLDAIQALDRVLR